MKIGIATHSRIKNADIIAKEVLDFLSKENDVVLDKEAGEILGHAGVPLPRMDVDILVTVGGDGTILKALRETEAKILGINAGVVGFLTEVSLGEIIEKLKMMLEGRYIVDKRMKLRVELNGKRLKDCTNEAVIHTSHIAKMRHFDIYIDGNPAADIRADGIIVATPTGSTCYAMSAGAPIIDPRVNAIVTVPLAPFKLSARPLVVPAESRIKIKSRAPGRPCLLVLDGQEEIGMKGNDEVELTASESYAEFIRFDEDFYKRVEEKLMR